MCGLEHEIYGTGSGEVAASGCGRQERSVEMLHDATDFIPGILCGDVDCGAGVPMYCVAPIKISISSIS